MIINNQNNAGVQNELQRLNRLLEEIVHFYKVDLETKEEISNSLKEISKALNICLND